MGFMFYAGPVDPAGLLDPGTAAGLAGVLFFGDDFGDWLGGFDTRAGWRLVGVSRAYPEEVEALGVRSVGEFLAGRTEPGLGMRSDSRDPDARPGRNVNHTIFRSIVQSGKMGNLGS